MDKGDDNAQVLGVKKRQISLDKGATDRSKILLVSEVDISYVHEKLKQAIE
jgi:uncharacterized protein YggU (UPF0235/DUF167 family)